MLAGTPAAGIFPDLLVGKESSDDAAVYRLNDTQAIVATTDFFMPIVDDPYDFGCIAATNAISDVYAMGGKPFLALALLGVPIGKLPMEDVQRIVAGGHDVCARVGVPIGGGHSIDAPEPMYGLVVLGLVKPDEVKRNDRARPGDVLILGKGLGIGILSAALKKGELRDKAYRQMRETATQLNTPGLALSAMPGVHAMTDVTGFGLLGHLLEICRGSKLAARLDFGAVPLLSAARHLAEAGYIRSRPQGRETPPARGHSFLVALSSDFEIAAYSRNAGGGFRLDGSRLIKGDELIVDFGKSTVANRFSGYGAIGLPYFFSDRITDEQWADDEFIRKEAAEE